MSAVQVDGHGVTPPPLVGGGGVLAALKFGVILKRSTIEGLLSGSAVGWARQQVHIVLA